jgi:myosin heavy subunit
MTVTANLDMIEVYSKDIKAWFPDEEKGWVSASVISKVQDNKSVKITFQDDDDAEKVNFIITFFHYFLTRAF